jgi:hypothetical protein
VHQHSVFRPPQAEYCPEFHYPQELSPENLDEVRSALGAHDIYCIAGALHLDPWFGRGGLVNPDPARAGDEARQLGLGDVR